MYNQYSTAHPYTCTCVHIYVAVQSVRGTVQTCTSRGLAMHVHVIMI